MDETGQNGNSSGREHADHVLWIVIGFCLVVPVILADHMGRYYLHISGRQTEKDPHFRVNILLPRFAENRD